MSDQLVLGLQHDPALSDADFFVTASNEAAHRLIETWPDWPAPAAIIYGPPGSGKTHLANIWRVRAAAALLPAAAYTTQHLADSRPGNIALDDADRARLDETAVFHLLNMAREQRFSVLLTSRAAPGQWAVSLPDLRSRIRSYPAVAISQPDDELLSAVVVKLFADRQLTLAPEAVPYLIHRTERSLQAIEAVVSEIDRASLASHRRLTKAFIASVLKTLV